MNKSTLPESLGYVCSNEFAAEMNIASGTGMFINMLHERIEVQELIDYLNNSDGGRGIGKHQDVHDAVLQLLEDGVDSEYAHPYDTAIAACLYALRRSNSVYQQGTASAILQAQNIFWARKIAHLILSEASIEDWLRYIIDREPQGVLVVGVNDDGSFAVMNYAGDREGIGDTFEEALVSYEEVANRVSDRA